jgi:hypothetical protein
MIEREDNSLDFLEKTPNKVLITYSDGSSEVFDNFVLYSMERGEISDDKIDMKMETIIKLPCDLDCRELLALVYGINDTVSKILSNGFENNCE